VDGHKLVQPLTAPAQDYVRHLWGTQCQEQLVDQTVHISFTDHVRQVSGPNGHLLQTTLAVRRLNYSESMCIVATDGSVLYNLKTTGTAHIPARRGVSRIPLAILPGNRCDVHAIGQATVPYDFSLILRIGDRPVLKAIRPPLPIQKAASEMLSRHCRTVGPSPIAEAPPQKQRLGRNPTTP
ncbi:MAG: hypothetical protein ACRDOY_00265, partial [Nocardioidaceae bacterium]